MKRNLLASHSSNSLDERSRSTGKEFSHEAQHYESKIGHLRGLIESREKSLETLKDHSRSVQATIASLEASVGGSLRAIEKKEKDLLAIEEELREKERETRFLSSETGELLAEVDRIKKKKDQLYALFKTLREQKQERLSRMQQVDDARLNLERSIVSSGQKHQTHSPHGSSLFQTF